MWVRMEKGWMCIGGLYLGVKVERRFGGIENGIRLGVGNI
jgi:hypothetical protein